MPEPEPEEFGLAEVDLNGETAVPAAMKGRQERPEPRDIWTGTQPRRYPWAKVLIEHESSPIGKWDRELSELCGVGNQG